MKGDRGAQNPQRGVGFGWRIMKGEGGHWRQNLSYERFMIRFGVL